MEYVNLLDYSIAGKYENTTIQIKLFQYFTYLVQYKLSISYFISQKRMLCLNCFQFKKLFNTLTAYAFCPNGVSTHSTF